MGTELLRCVRTDEEVFGAMVVLSTEKNQPKVKDSKGLLLFSEEEEDFDKNSRQYRSKKLCLFQTGESEKFMDVQQV